MFKDILISIVVMGVLVTVYSIVESPAKYETVIEVQEGEIWTKPSWVPEPSYAFPSEDQDDSEED